MEMSSLEERLKRIRQITTAPSKEQDKRAQAFSDTKDTPDQDDVHALILKTADEVAVESQISVTTDGDEELEAWLGCDSEEEGQQQGDSKMISSKELQDVTVESEQMTRDAKRALQELRQKGLLSTSTSLLQLEPKEHPILSRTSSDESYKSSNNVVSGDSLENDLADAMAGELGTAENVVGDQIRLRKKEEVDELSIRLAQLRANDRLHGIKQDKAAAAHIIPSSVQEDSTSFLFNLPSAPKTQPVVAKRDEGDLDWKEKHRVQGRDLSSYEALVRLNATTLGAPSFKPKTARGEQGEEIEETDEWCCICNEDARVQCLGCDRDLYCQKCWNEGHLEMDRDELAEHVTKIFAGHYRRRKQVAA